METDHGALEKGLKPRSQSHEVDDAADDSGNESYARRRRSSSSDPGTTEPSLTPSRASSALSIDPENPGPWVLHHHKGNFITELKKPPKTFSDKAEYYFKEWTEELSRSTKRLLNINCEKKKDHGKIENRGKWEDRRFRLSFAELQRMKLRKLQIALVGNVVNMLHSNRDNAKWENNLREYVQALQDYDYMSTRSKELADPFLVTGERYVDHRVLQRAMGDQYDYFVQEKYELDESIGEWKERDEISPIGGTRNENIKNSEWRNFRRRLEMAVFGAVFLLGPMWLMVLHRTKYTALGSTTAFVIVFGAVMVKYLDKEMDVLSATAAYAAVLVVFVGLNT